MRRNLTPREMRCLDSLDPLFAPGAEQILAAINEKCEGETCHLMVVYGRRSAAEQLQIFMKGRELRAPHLDPRDHASWRVTDGSLVVTDALPGESPHNSGLAMDVALLEDASNTWLEGGRNPDPRWVRLVGNTADAFGKEWGGRFRRFDGAHIQEHDWLRHAVTRS